MSKRPCDEGYAPGWCIHYRYNRDAKPGQPNTCEAGVDYNEFRGDGGTYKTQPCFLTDKGEARKQLITKQAASKASGDPVAVLQHEAVQAQHFAEQKCGANHERNDSQRRSSQCGLLDRQEHECADQKDRLTCEF